MVRAFFLAVGFLTSALAEDCAAPEVKYEEYELTQNLGGFTVGHSVQGDTIYLRLAATHDGWLGFGFAEQLSGHMKGSDMVTVQVTEEGMVQVQDRYATFSATDYDASSGRNSYAGLTATEDVHNDWTIRSGSRDSNGRMVVEISRKLDTGDQQDRAVIEGPTRVVWGHGAGNYVGYHGPARGTDVIYFIGTPSQGMPHYDGSIKHVMDDFPIPTQTTTYGCQAFKFPNDKVRHVIGFRPIIHEDTKWAPHHYLVHICEESDYFQGFFERPGLCVTKPESAKLIITPQVNADSGCSSIMVVWSKGMKDFVLPPEAGFAIGPGRITHVVLEIHYDNAAHREGAFDRSGYEAFYVDALREHDAGVLELGDPTLGLGALPENRGVLPPNEPEIHRYATCPGACTGSFDQEITVFASWLHMHNYGHKIYTDLYDEEHNFLYTTARIDNWDNGFQSTMMPPGWGYKVKPGQSLQTHCWFDTTIHDNSVVMGTETEDEMCIDFAFYYPVQYKGANAAGEPVPLANCGLMTFNVGTPNPRNTICGSMSQANKGFFMMGQQSDRDDGGFEDPLHFGDANVDRDGTAGQKQACTKVDPECNDTLNGLPCSPSSRRLLFGSGKGSCVCK